MDTKSQLALRKDMLHVAHRDLPDHGDAVWASLLCTHYSIARTTSKPPRHLVYADSLVLNACSIISWYPGVRFCIENPPGLLKHRAVFQGIPRFAVSACQYKDDRWPQLYRTRAHLWSSCSSRPHPLCVPQTCTCCHNGKHWARAPFWHTNTEGVKLKNLRTKTLYTTPPGLAQSVYARVQASPLQGV